MNREELKNLMPPTPDHFVSRMDETLKEIENMNGKHMKRTGATILLAAAITVLLAGTAVAAANSFGLFEYYKTELSIVPQKGAEKEIESNLVEYEDEYARIAIEEATYIGNTVALMVRFWPEEGIRAAEPIFDFLNAEWRDETGSNDHLDDGSVSYWIEATAAEGAPELLKCQITMQLYRGDEWPAGYGVGEDWEPVGDEIVLPIQIQRKAGQKVHLVPQGVGNGWNIASATLYYGKLFSSIEVDTCWNEVEDGAEVPWVYVKMPDGTELQDHGGSMVPIQQEDGMMVYRQIGQIQSPEELPDTLYLHAKTPGGDWLDAIECRVEIAD